MAYTLCEQWGDPKPLRVIVKDATETPKLGEEFRPYWWVCDPCNRSGERYEIEFRANQAKPTGYAWYQVVTTDDSEDDIRLKLEHYGKVIAARKAADAAQREYERLNGGR